MTKFKVARVWKWPEKVSSTYKTCAQNKEIQSLKATYNFGKFFLLVFYHVGRLFIFDGERSQRDAFQGDFEWNAFHFQCPFFPLGSFERLPSRGFRGHHDEPRILPTLHYFCRATAGRQQGHVQTLCRVQRPLPGKPFCVMLCAW